MTKDAKARVEALKKAEEESVTWQYLFGSSQDTVLERPVRRHSSLSSIDSALISRYNRCSASRKWSPEESALSRIITFAEEDDEPKAQLLNVPPSPGSANRTMSWGKGGWSLQQNFLIQEQQQQQQQQQHCHYHQQLHPVQEKRDSYWIDDKSKVGEKRMSKVASVIIGLENALMSGLPRPITAAESKRLSVMTHKLQSSQDFNNGAVDGGGSIITAPPRPPRPTSNLIDFNDQVAEILEGENGDISSIKEEERGRSKKDLQFWIVFISLLVVTVLTSIDLAIISTALPTIVQSLPATNVSATWITGSFLLTTTAFLPFSGGLADVIGRRNALIFAVLVFLAGSLIGALAKTMLILVVGRAVQGVGGAGIQALSEIILSDLTTLKERGFYLGLCGLVYALGAFLGPVLGGYFSEHNWRLIFWINLPIGGIALAMVVPCMKLHIPPMSSSAKFHRLDLFANLILLAGMIGIMFGTTEGGIHHPWSDWRILGSIFGGLIGLTLFFALEFIPNRFARDPVLPLRLFKNQTTIACFLQTFLHGIICFGVFYVIPLYFQSIKGATPLESAIDSFPATAPNPFSAIFANILMAITGQYKFQLSVWWAVTAIGVGHLYLLNEVTPVWQWVTYQVVTGIGVGPIFTLPLPPIQSNLPVEELAHATAAFTFCRSFGTVWGIAIGTNVFIGTVNSKLAQIPGTALIGLNGSTSLGFATGLKKLPTHLLIPVRAAYVHAIQKAILCFIPLAVLGFFVSLFVVELPLPDYNKTQHGLIQAADIQDEERGQQQSEYNEKGETPAILGERGDPDWRSQPMGVHFDLDRNHSTGSNPSNLNPDGHNTTSNHVASGSDEEHRQEWINSPHAPLYDWSQQKV